MSGETDIASLLAESSASFLSRRHRVARQREMSAHAQGYDPALWAEMAELGWLGLRLNEDLGGLGLGLADAAPLVSAFGSALLPEPFITCGLMPGVVLDGAELGPRRAGLARQLASGSRRLGLAWQERIGHLDHRAPATTLERRDSAWILAGAKVLAPAADILIVSARGPDGLTLAAIDAAGLPSDRTALADGGVALSLRLEAVPVDPDAVLASGGRAEALLGAAIAEGTIAAAIFLEAIASEALARTAAFLRQRVQFDQPLAHFQALRHRIVDLLLATELSRSSWRNALRAHGTHPGEAAAEIGAAKARASDAALVVTRAAVQMHGAMGYTEESEIGLFLKAALRWAPFLGGADAHRRRVLAGLTEQAA